MTKSLRAKSWQTQEDPDQSVDLNDTLAEALGVQSLDSETASCARVECGCEGQEERPTWVVSTPIPNSLKATGQPWANKRLRFHPKARLATKGQRKDILRRDGWCCQTPGCPNKIWLHLHHLKSYAQGGETVPENLLSMCSGCHANLHAGDLQIRFDSNDKIIFTDRHREPLDRRADLELAHWLDRWHGWRGAADESHHARAQHGQWTVFA